MAKKLKQSLYVTPQYLTPFFLPHFDPIAGACGGSAPWTPENVE